MPIIPGVDLEDAASTALADASAAVLGEPNLDFSTLVNQTNYVLAGAGAGILQDIAGVIVEKVMSLLLGGDGMPAAVATIDDIQPIFDGLGYGNPPVGNINTDLSDLLAYLTSEFGTIGTEATTNATNIRGDISGVSTKVDGTPGSVWGYHLANYGHAAGDVLEDAGVSAVNLAAHAMYPLKDCPGFLVQGYMYSGYVDTLTSKPAPDWSDIRADDTRLTWLQRTELNNTWSEDVTTGAVFCHPTGYGGQFEYHLGYSEAEFTALKNTLLNLNSGSGSALWPGIDNVTLGTPVALAEGVTIAEAMDGVLIAMSVIPPKTGSYTFDTQESYLHMGGVAFYSDNGDYEQAQSFSFVNHIIMPKAIAHPAGCVLRCKGNTVGTATPFTINT